MSEFNLGGFEVNTFKMETVNNTLKDNHEKFKSILDECQKLRWRKLNDYGMTYNEYGYVGLLVKLGDKYGRIKNLYQKSLINESPNFESERDSLIDLINYAVMALMELENKNKK